MITTGIMFGTGDILAQKMFPPALPTEDLEENKKRSKLSLNSPVSINSSTDITTPWNIPRTLRAVTYGCLFFAPITVMWQGKILPRITNPFIRNFRRSNMSPRRLHVLDTVFRVSVDQLIMPGLVLIPLYNTIMVFLAMHENPIELIQQKLQNGWWRVLKAGWTVWPGFQLVNMLFVPVHFRIVATNIWSVGWTCFLSFCHNTKGHGKGSGHKFEEIADIQDGDMTMAYD